MAKARKKDKDYELLFDVENQISIAEILKHQEVLQYRTKTITSGSLVECEIYPIYKKTYLKKVKAAKEKITPESQKAVNERNTRKKVIRLLNTNFDSSDLVCHLTYAGDAPDQEQAQKDIRNYIRRVKDFRKKNNLPELKYLYVMEWDDGYSGRAKRIHHHIVMNNMDRDTAEQLWPFGWANCDRLKPDEFGLEALGRYMVKNPNGQKRWAASRNLKKPVETIADHKVTVRQVERIAVQMEDQAGKIFASKFPACNLLDIAIKRSEHIAGAYVYAKMRKQKKGGTNNGQRNSKNYNNKLRKVSIELLAVDNSSVSKRINPSTRR